ncbi:MAG: IS110 family transposase [Clostridiales bacterium]|nr:IS110 family transposase [Clostridiales bacterium]
MRHNPLSTLFVGIDVSLKKNVLCAMNFHSDILLKMTVSNNHPGSEEIVSKLLVFLNEHHFDTIVIACESTSVYSLHLANFLSSNELLGFYNTFVYCLNPKTVKNYKKSFIETKKTDPYDAFIIADFARVGRISTKPWNGSGYLALKRLTRHRLHLVECITREKSYFLTNLFLKFSELASLSDIDKPFSDKFGATSVGIMTDFLSLEDIANTSLEDLTHFINSKSRHRITDPEQTAKIIHQAIRNSYRLDESLYEPLTTSLSTSINCINAFKREIEVINKAILKAVKGLNNNEYQCLLAIPGIGPVLAAGIIAEIGSISAFNNHNALASYAGLTWYRGSSGDFESDESHMTKTGDKFLRYYLIEAANITRKNIPEHERFYSKKFHEVKKHQHKRALALTARKLIRLIFGLLAKDQLFSFDKVDSLS